VPPNPIVTVPSSTITGTSRRPPEYFSIRWRPAWSFLTLTYSNAIRLLA
jgi:hypothetical protein